MKPAAARVRLCRALCLALLLLLVNGISLPLAGATIPPGTDPPATGTPRSPEEIAADALRHYRESLQFESNHGQWDPEIKYQVTLPGTLVRFMPGAVTFSLVSPQQPVQEKPAKESLTRTPKELIESRPELPDVYTPGHTYHLKWVGANELSWRGKGKQAGHANIFKKDTHIRESHAAKEVWTDHLYDGIHLRFYTSPENSLEYDYILEPGADYRQIRTVYEGVEHVRPDGNGGLLLRTSVGEAGVGKPYVYQKIAGSEHIVTSTYVILEDGSIGFSLDETQIDPGFPLIIDPVAVVWSTYFGGNNYDELISVCNDATGIYALFLTGSTDFPVSPGAFQYNRRGSEDMAIVKMDFDGNRIWSTYIGGSGYEQGYAMEVDANGLYVTGLTHSEDFPVIGGVSQSVNNGSQDIVVMRMNKTSGDLVWSTYLGGNSYEQFYGGGTLNVNPNTVTIVGYTQSMDFPTTPGVFRETGSTALSFFVTQFNKSTGAVNWSTFFNQDDPYNYHMYTYSSLSDGTYLVMTGEAAGNMPVAAAAPIPSNGNVTGAFLARLRLADGTLEHCSYLQNIGNYYYMNYLSQDADRYFLAGPTFGGFTTTPGAFQPNNNGSEDVLLVSVNKSNKQIAWSTHIGGSSGDNMQQPQRSLRPITIEGDQLYLLIKTQSPDFPTTSGAFQTGPYPQGYTNALINFHAPTGTVGWSTYYTSTTGLTDYNWTEATIAAQNGILYLVLNMYNDVDYYVSEFAFQQEYLGSDTYVAQLDGATGYPLCATFVGGYNHDFSYGMIPHEGDVIIAGITYSQDFPVSINGFQTNLGGSADGFFARLTGCCLDVVDNSITPSFIEICRNATPPMLVGSNATFEANLPPLYRNGVVEEQNMGGQAGAGQYQWQVSFDQVNWLTIGGAIEKNYQPSPSTQSRYFRRIIGCDTSAVASVLVNEDIAPVVVPGGPFLICPGSEIQLGGSPTVQGANGAYSITWSPAASLDNPSTDNPTASPLQTTLYTVTVEDALGCRVIKNTTVWILRANAGPDKTICERDTLRIGSSPLPAIVPISYQWSVVSGDAASIVDASNIPRPRVAPSETTTYEIAVWIASDTCVLRDQVTVQVRQRPQADAGEDKVICQGTPVQIGPGVTDPAYNYSWQPRVGLSSYIISSPFYDGLRRGECSRMTYHLQVSDPANVCPPAYDTMSVDIIHANAGFGGCASRVIGTPDPSCGRYTYTWSVTNGDAASIVGQENLPMPVVNPNVHTTYQLVVSYGMVSCTSFVAVYPCVVISCPQYYITHNVPVNCETREQVVPFCISLPNPQGFYFEILDEDAFIEVNGYQVCLVEQIPADRSYTIRYTKNDQSESCLSTLVFRARFVPEFDILLQDLYICPSSQDPSRIQLGESAQPDFSYSWTPATGLDNPLIANPSLEWQALEEGVTTYTVVKTHRPTGCQIIRQMDVQIREPHANAGPDRFYCDGIYTVIGTPGPGDFEYLWSPEEGLDDPTIAQPTLLLFGGTGTVTFLLSVTDPLTGCNSQDEIVLIEIDAIQADAGPDQTICRGQSITLGGDDLSEEGYIYTWIPATGLDNPNSANPEASPTMTTTYTLYVRLNGSPGCDAFSQVTVTVNESTQIEYDMGADVTVCQTGDIVIGPEEEEGVTYTWSPATRLSDIHIAQPTATVTGDFSYVLTALDNQNCTYWIDTLHIRLETKEALAGQDRLLCSGDTVTIGAPARSGYTYSWTPEDNLEDPSAALTKAYPPATTTYILNYATESCSFADTVLVVVDELPEADAGPDQTVCSGAVTVGPPTVNPAWTYRWTPAAAVSNPNIANPTTSPTVSTTLVLTVTSPAGCTDRDTVIVRPSFSISYNNRNHRACLGSTITIGPNQPSNDLTYSWAPADKLNDPEIANPVFTADEAGTYSLTLTVSDGESCTKTYQVQVEVIAPGSIDIGADNLITCLGGCVEINATISGSFGSLVWFPQDGVSHPNSGTTVICPPEPAEYILTGITAGTNCIVRDTVYIDMLQVPAPEANAGPNITVCLGSTAVLGSPGEDGVIYDWSPATFLVNSTVPQPTFLANVLGTYSYTLSALHEESGCTNSDIVEVRVVDFDIFAQGNVSVCSGDSSTLNAHVERAYNMPLIPSDYTYNWSPAPALNDPTLQNPRFAIQQSTLFTVTVTHTPSGCAKTYQVFVEVSGEDRPVVDLPGQFHYCDANTDFEIPLEAQDGYRYTWSPTSKLSNPNIANPTVQAPLTNGLSYVVTVEDTTRTDGCRFSTRNIQFFAFTPAALSNQVYDLCTGGQDSILIGPGDDFEPGAVSFLWTPGNGLSGTTVQNPMALPSNTRTYTLFVTYESTDETYFIGCQASANYQVRIQPLPVFEAGPDTLICNGSVVRLGGADNPTLTYSWSPNYFISATTVARPYVNPPQTTTYTVEVTNVYGCSNRDSVTVSVSSILLADVATTDASCLGGEDGTISFSVGGGIAPYGFAWTTADGDGLIEDEQYQSSLTAGTYRLVVTDAHGCSIIRDFVLADGTESCCEALIFASVPEDITIDCSDELPDDEPLVSEHCCESWMITHEDEEAEGDCPGNRIITRTFTATDICGNSAVATRTITITDTNAPETEGCASLDMEVECDGTDHSSLADDWHAANMLALLACSTDDCSGELEILSDYDYANFRSDCGASGSLEVNYRVSDACGNLGNTITAVLTVSNTTAPDLDACMLDLDANISCNGTPAEELIASWHADNIARLQNCSGGPCSGSLTVLHDLDDQAFEQACGSTGSVTVQYMLEDECGNTSDPISATLVITDDTAPDLGDCTAEDRNEIISCDEETNGSALEAWHQANISYLLGCATDECNTSLEVMHDFAEASFTSSCGNGGTYTVIYTVFDACGNGSEPISLSITLEDDTAPDIGECTIATDITIECDPDATESQIQQWHEDNITALYSCGMDRCGSDWSVESDFNESTVEGDCGSSGSLTVRYWLEDACGNASDPLTATLHISDTTAPVLEGCNLPLETILSCENGPTDEQILEWHTQSLAALLACAADACSSELSVVHNFEEAVWQSTCGNAGYIEVEYQVADECGNLSEAIVLRASLADDTAPDLEGCSLPADVSVACTGPDFESVLNDWHQENLSLLQSCATDGCSADLTVTHDFDIAGFVPSCGYTGSIQVSYTVADECGNQSQPILSRLTITDTGSPVFTYVPADLTLSCDQEPDEESATALDGCGDVEIVMTDRLITGDCPSNQTIERVFTATDECGNSTTAVQLITFVDEEAPVFSLVPDDVTISCDENVPLIPAGASDNCGETTITHQDNAAGGDCSGNSIITRTFVATDECGNSATAVQIITVVDEEAPVFSFIPPHITLSCDETIPFVPAVAEDNCSETTLTHHDEVVEGNCSGNRAITRVFIATDECGNSATAVQLITVTDEEAPVFSFVPQHITLSCDETIPFVPAVAEDNCSAVQMTHTDRWVASTGCPQNGILYRTFTATDDCGNQRTAQQTITVEDTTPPALQFIHPELRGVASGSVLRVQCHNNDPSWSMPNYGLDAVMITDACDETPVLSYQVIREAEGDCRTDGYFFRLRHLWTAADDCGNTDSLWFTVEMIDTIAPLLHGVPEDITVSCREIPPLPHIGECGDEDSCCEHGMITISDECECAEAGYEEIILGNTCDEQYRILRIWSGTDHCGNVGLDTQVITVLVDPQLKLVMLSPYLQGYRSGDEVILECDGSGDLPQWVDLLDEGSVVALNNCHDTDMEVRYQRFTDGPAPDCRGNGYLQSWMLVWTVQDGCGHYEQLYYYLHLRDTRPPVITGDTAVCRPELAKVSATDICSDPALRYTDTEVPSVCIAGELDILRTWTATDACGNTAVFVQRILTGAASGEPVIILMNRDIQQAERGELVRRGCSIDSTWTGFSAKDVEMYSSCGARLEVSYSEELKDWGDCLNDGYRYLVAARWWATDPCAGIIEFDLVVEVIDEEAPVFHETHIVVECGDPIPDPKVSDNCSDFTVNLLSEERHASGDCEHEYYLLRTYEAVDDCGNRSTSEVTIQVIKTAATIVFYGIGPNEYCGNMNIPIVKALDGCSGDEVQVHLTQTVRTNPCGSGNEVTRRWWAVDECGNVSEQIQKIYVNDTIPPALVWQHDVYKHVIDGDELSLACFDARNVDQQWKLGFRNTDVGGANGCPVEVSLESAILGGGDCLTDGYLSRERYTWTARDLCGNTNTFSITVNWIDTIAPQLRQRPANETVICSELPPVPVVTAYDLCSEATVSFTETVTQDGSWNMVARTWTATDACGNSSSHTQVIRHRPESPISCSIFGDTHPSCNSSGNELRVNVQGGAGPYTYEWVVQGGVCFIESGQGTPRIQYAIGLSKVLISVTITDAAGCMTTCELDFRCNPEIDGGSRAGTADGSLVIGSVFPNPALSELYVRYSSNTARQATIRILDMLGRPVSVEEGEFLPSENLVRLNIRHLRPGLYYLETVADDVPVLHKFVKY